jgi:hypothetical protein
MATCCDTSFTGLPTHREPIRLARGTYCSLYSNRDMLCDGEVVYAEDLRALFIAECRNGRIELNPVRSTIRPEAPPVLRLQGFIDLTQPSTLTGLQHGDLLVNTHDGTADASWRLPPPATVTKGDVLVWDGTAGTWIQQSGLVGLPNIPLDLSTLPLLP